MRRWKNWRLILSAAMFFGAAHAAPAQNNGFALELNNAIDTESGCRLIYVAVNKTGTALEKTSYQIFTFDADGRVAQSLVFQFGALPKGKTKVVQFDLAGTPCSNISRILINDIADCMVDGNPSSICMDELVTTTRTSIEFGI